jgi:hypothetical protein
VNNTKGKAIAKPGIIEAAASKIAMIVVINEATVIFSIISLSLLVYMNNAKNANMRR